ncbi:MAG: DUF2855 domain-containing protein, partial [Bacteroidota bacterium]
AQKRQNEWGGAGFQQKVGAAWREFAVAVQPKLAINEVVGPKALQDLYLDMVQGKVDPKQGNIVRLGK